jgi:hypothetical protein
MPEAEEDSDYGDGFKGLLIEAREHWDTMA